MNYGECEADEKVGRKWYYSRRPVSARLQEGTAGLDFTQTHLDTSGERARAGLGWKVSGIQAPKDAVAAGRWTSAFRGVGESRTTW